RIVEPLIRDGGELRPVSWERALQEAAAGLKRAGAKAAAIAGSQSTNEEGYLLSRLLREALGSPHLDSRRAGALPLELHRALGAPELQARVSDLEFAHAVLVLDADPVNDAPILDLRLRKGIRRRGLKLAVASPGTSSLEPSAALAIRFQAGASAAFTAALASALAGRGDLERLCGKAGVEVQVIHELVELLRGPQAEEGADGEAAPREVVVLWGERLSAGSAGGAGADALLDIAGQLALAEIPGAGLLEIPAASNGRGLREAGVLPNGGAGLAEASQEGRDSAAIAKGLASGELSALYLLQCDPLRDLPDRALWERALAGASTVVAHAAFLTDAIREHAHVVFPAEAYPEKEGTVVHPDGRLQRLRPAIARPGSVRAGWHVIAELALQLGLDFDVLSGAMASRQLLAAVPFYAGLTLEEIGGRGVRWQERDGAAAFPRPTHAPVTSPPESVIAPEDAADVAGYRSVWDAPEVEHSPAFDFLFKTKELV
ncbi:MAG TPA: molybdopterin-dependent oxidoreductase, partial [Solirubrobacteraceae bacterium]|nr:molybdopterin-dependent oxidoreductase [Solirubrobacteraceae bacterium]